MKKSWRTHNHIIPDFDNEPKPAVPTRFLDQVSFIGNELVGCYLVETSEGLVLLDCMEPNDRSRNTIEQGIKELGLDIRDLKAILISHGHFDHYGQADYFRKKYGCKLYLGETDTELAKTVGLAGYGTIDYDIDEYYRDGGVIKFGDVEITTILTPGHTAGCYSFIFDVTDDGVKHTAGMWGGSGLLRDSDPDAYEQSLDKFCAICKERHVDVELASHPFLDNGLDRHTVVRNIVDGVPNPFVIGEEGFRYYMSQYYALVEKRRAMGTGK